MIELLKRLTKESDETILAYWIDKAAVEIKEYLKVDCGLEIIIEKYDKAIIQLVCNYVKVDKEGGVIASKSQGQRSVNYVAGEGIEFDKRVKNLLPKPRLRCY